MNLKTLADGVFDPVHVGHLDYLRVAASLGLPLAVNIAPDDVLHSKGRTPFQTRRERSQMLMSIVGVSETMWWYDSLAQAVRDLKPMFLVKGMEWHGRLPEAVIQACAETKTSIVYTATRGKSSTERLAWVDTGIVTHPDALLERLRTSHA